MNPFESPGSKEVLDVLEEAIESIYASMPGMMSMQPDEKTAHDLVRGSDATVATICYAFSKAFDVPLPLVLDRLGVPTSARAHMLATADKVS